MPDGAVLLRVGLVYALPRLGGLVNAALTIAGRVATITGAWWTWCWLVCEPCETGRLSGPCR